MPADFPQSSPDEPPHLPPAPPDKEPPPPPAEGGEQAPSAPEERAAPPGEQPPEEPKPKTAYENSHDNYLLGLRALESERQRRLEKTSDPEERARINKQFDDEVKHRKEKFDRESQNLPR